MKGISEAAALFEEVHKSFGEGNINITLWSNVGLSNWHNGHIRPPKRAVFEELQRTSIISATTTP